MHQEGKALRPTDPRGNPVYPANPSPGAFMADSFSNAAGSAILELREALNLTQAELAERFNAAEPAHLTTTRSDIAKYETGHAVPPGDKLLKFLRLRGTNE